MLVVQEGVVVIEQETGAMRKEDVMVVQEVMMGARGCRDGIRC